MKLLEPIMINHMELKNRMVVSAMVTNYCDPDGNATEKYIAYHEHKAKGGWGLIITEDYAISPTAGAFIRLPGLWQDGQIASHKRLTDRVHTAGGTIAAQLYHAGRETTRAITGAQPVAPSAIKDPTMPDIPRALTIEEIHSIISLFGDAALRAKKAGFDAVEIHGAHGYLVGQFVSPFSNKRTDEYGGSVRNRARFAVEIVKDIKEKCGKDFPVLYRMSAQEYVPGGLGLEEAKALALLLQEAGVDCFHVSQGIYTSGKVIIPSFMTPKGAFTANAAAIRSAVDVPVIAVGRINDPDVAEAILRSGEADMVTMARASLADPELPNKVKAGQFDRISRCIGCLQGCSGENGKGNSVRCLVNPLTGMEDTYDLSPAAQPKNVIVVGGGVSGCEAAISAAMKGHKVTLLEESDHLGGQWIAAAVPLGKGDFTSLIVWQKNELKRLGVTVRLNTKGTIANIRLLHPDVVIAACGSHPFIPRIEGAGQDFVATAHDVLMGKTAPGRRVAVIGGGLVGAETADMLSLQAEQVSIIEMLPQIMKDAEPTPAALMMERFRQHHVAIYTSTKLVKIGDHSILLDHEGTQTCLEHLDQVIIAIGVRANTELTDHLDELGCRAIRVGDAAKVKNGYLGIREGFEAGLSI